MTTPADRVAAHNAGRHREERDPLCVLCADIAQAKEGQG